jgi:hypothetical protein
MKGYGIAQKSMGVDVENKISDFSVENIDRIQQRIQSILGKK